MVPAGNVTPEGDATDDAQSEAPPEFLAGDDEKDPEGLAEPHMVAAE